MRLQYAKRFQSVLVRIALAGAAVGVLGCGGGDAPADKAPVDAGASEDTTGGSVDTSTADSATADGGEQGDAGGGSDVGTADVGGEDTGGGTCPGAAGCPCADNSQCDQSMCLDTPAGSKCAVPCADDTSCTKGQACVSVKGAGGDTVAVCVDKAVRLCDPCKSNAACAAPGTSGSACVKRGGAGSFCGVSCDGGCPTGTTCRDMVDVDGKAVKQCMPAKDVACTCSPLAIQKELSTTCSAGGSDKAAAGCSSVRACLADGKEGAPAGGGLSACGSGTPTAEACNGTDDDCDGDVDEDADCDDKDACTTDACKAGGCTHDKITGACDDGDPCTDSDTCATGTCVGKKKACDDGSACTLDTCDKTKGCVQTPDNNGGSCDDGDACTADDTCAAGACTGKKKACDDGNPCTTDACDAKTGTCVNTATTGSCDDGNPCTVGDVCGKDAGSGQTACIGGKPKACDDGNPCTTDSCDKLKGCTSEVDTKITQPCYTADPKTKGVGQCKPGVQTCQASGSFGSCVGEVGPAAKETCNGKDDTCNGKIDDNCTGGGPPQLKWRLGSTVVQGGKAGGVQARMFVGGDSAVGQLGGSGKTSVELGFYAWLSAWIK